MPAAASALELKEKLSFTLAAVHVQHGIRGEESLQDAAFVEKLCRRYQVQLFRYDYDVPEYAKQHGYSEEEAGRNPCRMKKRTDNAFSHRWNSSHATHAAAPDHIPEHGLCQIITVMGLLYRCYQCIFGLYQKPDP